MRFRPVLRATIPALALTLLAQPAFAGWKLIRANAPVNVSGLATTPQSDWNSGGKIGPQAVIWTHDGFDLNELIFFGPVAAGDTLFKERSRKKDPFPHFSGELLLPELPDFYERSFRAVFDVTDFTITATEKSRIGNAPAITVRYRYLLPGDPLVRQGEARLAIDHGRLFAIAFSAPGLHYFDAGIVEVRAMMDGARVSG